VTDSLEYTGSSFELRLFPGDMEDIQTFLGQMKSQNATKASALALRTMEPSYQRHSLREMVMMPPAALSLVSLLKMHYVAIA
jgi:hypothetical protein